MDSISKKEALKVINIEKAEGVGCIGDIISQNLDVVVSLNIGKIIVDVNNSYMTGNYNIPTDLGLSTPIKLLEGGIIKLYSVNCKSHKINYLKLFKKWKKSLINSNVFKFTECMKSCYLCHEEYVLGTDIIKLPCNHIFHNTCISELMDSVSKRSIDDSVPLICMCPLCRYPI